MVVVSLDKARDAADPTRGLSLLEGKSVRKGEVENGRWDEVWPDS